MDISVIRHARPAADRALSIAARVVPGTWQIRLNNVLHWLTKPSDAYPQPPVPSDRNAAGLGWSGHERIRPFAPPQPPQLKQPTVHENLNPHPRAK